jgi:hypothetical protein
VAVARANRETEPAIERGRCIEVVHRVHDVIEAP